MYEFIGAWIAQLFVNQGLNEIITLLLAITAVIVTFKIGLGWVNRW